MDKPNHTIIINKQGLSFFCALTIILIILKVIGYNVEWFWIIAAFFGPIILLGVIVIGVVLFMVGCFILALIFDYYEYRKSKKIREEYVERNRKEFLKKRNKGRYDG